MKPTIFEGQTHKKDGPTLCRNHGKVLEKSQKGFLKIRQSFFRNGTL